MNVDRDLCKLRPGNVRQVFDFIAGFLKDVGTIKRCAYAVVIRYAEMLVVYHRIALL